MLAEHQRPLTGANSDGIAQSGMELGGRNAEEFQCIWEHAYLYNLIARTYTSPWRRGPSKQPLETGLLRQGDRLVLVQLLAAICWH